MTQAISSMEMPISSVVDQCSFVEGFDGDMVEIPGFIMIDTPGQLGYGNLVYVRIL